MNQSKAKLTVFFEEPFWIGLYEREFDGKYEVCKITFGAEPKDYEVYDFMLKNFHLLEFTPSLQSDTLEETHLNPKRMQREINKQMQTSCIGTKAQQALKLQHEQCKTERQIRSREQREAEKQRQFELKQEKRKQKHRGH